MSDGGHGAEVTLAAVSKSYGTVLAIRGLDLHVRSGELVLVTGDKVATDLAARLGLAGQLG